MISFFTGTLQESVFVAIYPPKILRVLLVAFQGRIKFVSKFVRYFPDKKTFENYCDDFDAIPVFRRILCDSLTPVSAFRRIDNGTDACLFESVVGGERVGRYSFLAVNPQMRLTASGKQVTTTTNDGAEKTTSTDNPLEEFRKHIDQVKVAQIEGLPPFTGGAVGYAAYDTVRYVEHLPLAPEDDRHLSDLSFAFYDEMLVFDHITKTLTIIALAWPSRFATRDEAFDDAM